MDYLNKISTENFQKIIDSLSKSEHLLKATLNNYKDIMIFAIDNNYKYLYFNDYHKVVMESVYGKEPQLGHNIFDYITYDLDSKVAKRNYDIGLSGKMHKTVEATKRENGVMTYYESRFVPIHSTEKEIIGVSVFARDITENEAIMENLERLNRSEGISQVGTWELDLDTNLIWGSKQAFKIYEISRDFDFFDVKQIKKMVSEEDNEKLDRALRNLLDKDETYNVFYTLNIGNKKKYINSQAITTKDKDGIPKKVLGVIRDITEMKKINDQLIYLSFHDSLTGLYNRRYFDENISKVDIEENYPITIVVSDINGLKLINDAFGHFEGDKLLTSTARILSHYCSETDLVARIGGDEFVILMPNTTELEAEEMIKKINDEAKKVLIGSIPLSISFGFATKTNAKMDIIETYRSAEDLMYRIKLLEVPSMRSGAIETILKTLHEKDTSSEVHSRNVSLISEKICIACGMNTQETKIVITAGLLHDIGKIVVPTSIITKKGKLTSDEYDVIKTHPEIGYRILNSTHDMRKVSDIVLSHHERWDGKGYPRGLRAEDIPMQSRIISIADAFDAMTTERTYRKVYTSEEALSEICKNAGTQFDPKLVEIFKTHFYDIIEPKKGNVKTI